MKIQILLLWVASGMYVDTKCDRTFGVGISQLKSFVLFQITSYVYKKFEFNCVFRWIVSIFVGLFVFISQLIRYTRACSSYSEGDTIFK